MAWFAQMVARASSAPRAGDLTFGQLKRGGGLVIAAGLREDHSRDRMHEPEVAAVAGGVQGCSRFAGVLAHDGGVADLAIAERQLVVGESDGARVVGELRLLQGAAVERDRARLLAAGVSHAAVEAPQRGEEDRRDRFAKRVGDRPSVVLACATSPCCRNASAKRTADRQLVDALQRGLEEAATGGQRRLRPGHAQCARPREPSLAEEAC